MVQKGWKCILDFSSTLNKKIDISVVSFHVMYS